MSKDTDQIGSVLGVIGEIAASAEEQSSVTEEINRNMVTIQEMANHLNMNGKETAGTTQQLMGNNAQCNDIVGRFKLS